jgi:hypothetical protein
VRIIASIQFEDGHIAISENGIGVFLKAVERSARDQSTSIDAAGESEVIHDLSAFVINVAVCTVREMQCP